jgi:hypothetical protein
LSSIVRTPEAPTLRRALLVVPLAVAISWAFLSFAATSVLAAPAHVFTGSFGGPCTGPGSTCEPGQLTVPLTEPSGVAVNEETGDVYVVDKGNDRVVVFNAAGTKLEGEFNGSGLLPGEGKEAGSAGLPGEIKTGKFENPEGIAVDNSMNPFDPSRGAVYVVDPGHDVVDKFSAGGAYEGQLTEACEAPEEAPPCPGSKAVPFTELAGVGVDLEGRVWVSQENGHIYEFSDAVVNQSLSQVFSPSQGSPGFAVDSEDNLYFHHAGIFEKLSSTETQEERAKVLIEAMDGEESTGAAVDQSNDDVYIDNVTSVREFSPTGAVIEPSIGEGHLTTGSGVGVNPRFAAVYVADSTAGMTSSFVAPVPPAVTTGEATSTQSEGSATLNGAVDARGVSVSSCEFEYVSEATLREGAGLSESLKGAVESITQGRGFGELVKAGVEENLLFTIGSFAAGPVSCEEPEIAEDQKFHPVHAKVSNLIPGTSYHFRLVAANADGSEPEMGKAHTFFSVAHPGISAEVATSITSSAATLNAQINPEGLGTTYSFEYGTNIKYGNTVPVPSGEIGAGTSEVAISQPINGLSANTTYHWRLVAHNLAGTTTGVDHTFIYNTTGAGLPEGRAYEMVTPPFKNGALLGSAQVLALSSTISEDGTRLIRSNIQCFGGAVSCPALTGGVLGTLFQFERTTAGWVATPLAPPATEFEENSGWGGNSNTGAALFSAPTALGEEDLYLREPGPPSPSFIDIGPLVEPGKHAIAVEHQTTPTLSHIVFALKVADKWSFDETTGDVSMGNGGEEESLYEYTGTGNEHPVLVGVTGGPDSDALVSRCATYYGEQHQSSPSDGYAVSEDGGTIFFTAHACAGGSGVNENLKVPVNELYARVDGDESGAAHTVAISQPQALLLAEPGKEKYSDQENCTTTECKEDTERPANPETETNPNWRVGVFQGASTNGSRAFFTSEEQLTNEAIQGSENLYEYDFTAPAGHNLIDVSEGAGGAPVPGGPRVQGVMAMAPDGSHVYFVAQGVLTNEERPGCKAAFEAAGEQEEGRCQPTEGASNLYVFERDASYPQGHLAFVATLSSDGESQKLKLAPDSLQWTAAGGGRANVTPEGRYLVFTSDARLTADDTASRQAQQVFRYNAATGQLVRISVGEDGFNDNGNAAAADAVVVGPGGAGDLVGPPRSDPTMSHDGQYVFFQSPVGLTPQALNEVPVDGSAVTEHLYAQNVYEYHEGHVYLISDGHDTAGERTTCTREVARSLYSAVCLIGSDATGRNVFFMTADPLVRTDVDTQLDIYDARICGEEACIQPPPLPAAPCLGEACHGTPAASPAEPEVPSVSFNGSRNVAPAPPPPKSPLTNAQKLAKALKSCRSKRNKHKRTVCEAQARKRYGTKAKKSAHGSRRTSR